MAEEKSAPKKAPKKEGKPAEAAAAEENKSKTAPAAEKHPAGDKAAPGAPGAEAAAPEAAKPATGADLLKDEITALKVRKAKGAKNITTGVAFVTASFNNTIVSITDLKGNVISWASAGRCNFRGSRKSTAYAAQIVAQEAARGAMAHGLKDVQIRVSGPGLGRDSAVRALQAVGLEITAIVDITPIPHNGCRPRKRRRV
jgi:small subunit ribosomal protein S11